MIEVRSFCPSQVLDVSAAILLGDSGAAFCAALGGNTGLKTLDLTDCRFDEGSLNALASAMTQCRTLETLVMDGAAAKGLVQASERTCICRRIPDSCDRSL